MEPDLLRRLASADPREVETAEQECAGLSEDQVREIASLIEKGYTFRQVASLSIYAVAIPVASFGFYLANRHEIPRFAAVLSTIAGLALGVCVYVLIVRQAGKSYTPAWKALTHSRNAQTMRSFVKLTKSQAYRDLSNNPVMLPIVTEILAANPKAFEALDEKEQQFYCRRARTIARTATLPEEVAFVEAMRPCCPPFPAPIETPSTVRVISMGAHNGLMFGLLAFILLGQFAIRLLRLPPFPALLGIIILVVPPLAYYLTMLTKGKIKIDRNRK